MNLPLAPLCAAVIGIAAAATVAALPAPMLEALVTDSGIGALVPAAPPPLGMTARLAVAGGVGALAAIFAWFALFLTLGTRIVTIGTRAADAPESVPAVRRADAHPDAPPRAPLRATRDLGTPFLEVHARLRKGDMADDVPPIAGNDAEYPDAAPAPAPVINRVAPEIAEPDDALVLDVPMPPEAETVDVPAPVRSRVAPAEAALPDDLDRPLSAYDPDAIPESPIAAPRSLTRSRRKRPAPAFNDDARFETFELTPAVRDAPPPPRFPVPAPAANAEAPITRPETEASIHALLERLERGVVRRGLAASRANDPEPAPPPAPAEGQGLAEALVTLRNLARRA